MRLYIIYNLSLTLTTTTLPAAPLPLVSADRTGLSVWRRNSERTYEQGHKNETFHPVILVYRGR